MSAATSETKMESAVAEKRKREKEIGGGETTEGVGRETQCHSQ